jgi:hypothetical protein
MRSRIMPASLLVLLACLFALAAHAAPAGGDAVPKPKHRLGGKPPYATPYAGLLPDGFQVQPAPPVDAAQLARSKVVMVPSSNFNAYSEGWAYYYEKGGFEKNWAVRLIGATREGHAGIEDNSDPRMFATRVSDALRPRVRELGAAADLREARAQGADYFLVVDAWLGTSHMGGHFVISGGAYLLDDQLRQVFAASGAGDAKRGGFFDFDVVKADTIAMTAAMAGLNDAVLPKFDAFLQALPLGQAIAVQAEPQGAAAAAAAPGVPNAGELFVQAMAAKDAGDASGARDALQRLLRQYPDSPLAAQAAQQLVTLASASAAGAGPAH